MAQRHDPESGLNYWVADDRTAIAGKHLDRIDLTNLEDPTGFGHPVTLLIQKRRTDWSAGEVFPVGPVKALTGSSDWEVGHRFTLVLDGRNGYRRLGDYMVVGRIADGEAVVPANAPRKVDGYFFD